MASLVCLCDLQIILLMVKAFCHWRKWWSLIVGRNPLQWTAGRKIASLHIGCRGKWLIPFNILWTHWMNVYETYHTGSPGNWEIAERSHFSLFLVGKLKNSAFPLITQCVFPQPCASWYIVKELVYKVFEILFLKAQTLWCETLKGFLHDLFYIIRYFWKTSDLFLKSDLLTCHEIFSFFKMLVALK